jgi:hypothetical protein
MAHASRFRPSRHGLGFTNSWPRRPAVRIPTPWGAIGVGNAGNGLCGGMVFAAADHFHARLPAPQERPGPDAALYRFIVRRIIDSWRLPGGVARYYRWMLLGDDAVAARTAEGEWPRIAALLDRGIPVPLGLVTVSSTNPARLRHNHQVLAWAREREGGRVTLRVYDPNRGPRDDVTITFDAPAPAGFEHTLGIRRPVRGFFRVPYAPKSPPG